MEKSKKKKIIIATGGTGGHIIPAVSLFETLKSDYDTEITTDKRGVKYLKNFNNIKFNVINSNQIFGKNLIKKIIGFITIFFSLLKSLIFLAKSKPALVVGMGGYSSFSICLAAYFYRIPILIYEINLVLGKTNKFLLPLVKKILVSNQNIKGIKDKYKKKIFFSGYYLRKEILELKKDELETQKKKLSILVIGGSQSAKIFSEALPSILMQCRKANIKFKIFQQCSEDNIEKLRKKYHELDYDFELFTYSESLSKYYKQSDIALTRSGASSLAELVNLRIPFIAIPLPSSVDNHQFENASYFEKKGYCFLIEERFINDKLYKILKDLNLNRNRLLEMKKKMENHSDKETLASVEKLIKETLNV